MVPGKQAGPLWRAAFFALLLISGPAQADPIADFIFANNPQLALANAGWPILGEAKIDLIGRYTYGQRTYDTLGGEEIDLGQQEGRQESYYQVGIRATLPLISPRERRERARAILAERLQTQNAILDTIKLYREGAINSAANQKELASKRNELAWINRRIEAGFENQAAANAIAYEILALEKNIALAEQGRTTAEERLLLFVPPQKQSILKGILDAEH